MSDLTRYRPCYECEGSGRSGQDLCYICFPTNDPLGFIRDDTLQQIADAHAATAHDDGQLMVRDINPILADLLDGLVNDDSLD